MRKIADPLTCSEEVCCLPHQGEGLPSPLLPLPIPSSIHPNSLSSVPHSPPPQVRGPLIQGLMAVKAAAKAAGAYGCTISGAGPTAVAICDNPDVAQKVGRGGGA